MAGNFAESSENAILTTSGMSSGQSNLIVGGHYKIVRQLAVGGFGQTFVAQDLHLPGQPFCVVKQLKTQFSNSAVIKTARRLFDQEAKVLYALGEHTQIPRLLAHFEEAQKFYLVQELVEGEPLSERLVPTQRWLEKEAITLLQDILQVLSFVHAKGVIHRDIKPANLLRRESDSRIVLIDFGAVKAVQQASTIVASHHIAKLQPSVQSALSTIAIGTPGYMPIEQQSGKPRFSSDVYAVGMVAIQALTGLPPTQIARNPKTEEIEWRSQAPNISSALADLIDTMVRYDFRSRFADASTALKALNTLSEQSLLTAASTPHLTQIAQNQSTHVQHASRIDQSLVNQSLVDQSSANQSVAEKPDRTVQYVLLIGAMVLSSVAAIGWRVGGLTLNSIVINTLADRSTESRVETAISVDSALPNANSSSSTASTSAPQAAIDLVEKADEHFA